MRFIKNFLELTRAYSLLVTFASCFIICSYAYHSRFFSWQVFIILAAALSALHLGANLYDDYKDIKVQLQTGKTLNEIAFEGFIPKAALILNKTFSIQCVRLIILFLFAFATGIGICFVNASGWPVLIFMLIGAILTLLYPISSKYCLAEITIGLIFGPLMIMGGYYALTLGFDFNLLLLSFAIFFATLTLLHSHNIMDWEFDSKNGKKTLAILSGSKENAIKLLALMTTISYLIIIAGVLFGNFNPGMLFVFLTLPIATKLLSSMKDYILIKDVEFKPRWYWGFFENWSAIKERGIDFFMFRFYLARNFAFFFALFASIGANISI